MGSPIAEWHAKPLGVTQDNIYPKLSRRLQNTESQKISSAAGESLRKEVHRAVSLFSEGMVFARELSWNNKQFHITCTELRCNGCNGCNGYQLHGAD